ncbi:gliding motility protein GldM [Draconibacterium sp. IB214405]|uniref:type IX secretion system motor protein PorM/GldM n=1 Tax=Draconibacterium sp. IB214405 TaxID=3097352 RepID=UPI002A0AB8CC|nr:gliding motility protein GldM [Draconibacterium sp. IB214405]MDX8337680.1 gliding motility protein GldM [Draconibacterium sp. IB214405]
MGAKNCPETPRQKMINMMYIVLTAMLALNVAAEVLEAFRVVDSSLLQTLEAVDVQNKQIYSAFEQAYIENPTKVQEWKDKSDQLRDKSHEMITYVSALKDEVIAYSGEKPVNEDNPMYEEGLYHTKLDGSVVEVAKKDDLNGPSELMITQKRATDLKNAINEYRTFISTLISEDDTELRETILSELRTSDPEKGAKGEGNYTTWESEHFEDKPLIAVMTLLSKIQIDVKNSEAYVAKYLYAEIDEGSFKFNRLGARVIANSNVVLMGDEYKAEVFLAAEDTTQQPVIMINGKEVEVNDGKATFIGNTSQAGKFTWSGLIKYKTPGGIIKSYPFEQEYQVSEPTVTMSATKMNVFYRGLQNPFDVGGGAIPNEDLEVQMTNGKVTKQGDAYLIEPTELDEMGRKTKVSVYATINGSRRLIGTTDWRVKRVPDPVAQIDGKSGGDIRKERLKIQDGILAVLVDFDFEFKYTITQFTMETTGQGGYINRYPANSNRFTPEQKAALERANINSIVYIADIKAVGDDGSTRDLDPISFKIK